MSDEAIGQVEGFCEGVMERGDWAEFHINIGRQYPVKLSTKKEDVKIMARMAGQSPAVWTYNESQGNPNPHKPGEFFKNRYLNNVEVGGQLNPAYAQQQAAAGQTTIANAPAGTGVQAPQIPGARDRSIERQVIVKSAMYLYPTDTIKTDEDWFALINKIDAFMVQVPEASAPAAEKTTEPEAAVPVDDDSDIPF